MRREEGHGTSPRLGALQEAIAVGKNGVLDAFWREIAMQGTPLIEPIADDAGHWLVTFLWRGDAATTHVDVIAGVLGDGFAAPYSLSRLSGSDVWYRTDRAAADMRNTYMLAPNQPQDGTLQARNA
ncbi:MAG TPA: enterochelin esterase domain-containing protein [Chloroflexota bacterium]|nr:enterochelin esterase domain-containing protein [Chloroflexota bacterium]